MTGREPAGEDLDLSDLCRDVSQGQHNLAKYHELVISYSSGCSYEDGPDAVDDVSVQNGSYDLSDN